MAYCCLFGGFLALGFILLILGLVKIKTHCEFDMSKEEEDSADRACVVGFWLFVSAIISFVLCSIPLYVKCCCTNPSVDMEINTSIQMGIPVQGIYTPGSQCSLYPEH
eukprot:TRINITY_DN21804_c0_g1_i1.p3 TRINITY_DN21804_c0_g1~~TRINITY_DN21804_c0_g1_i1.p3  ORF type:complete len:108 (+),score=0.98 TRINITY_DN21804_c0_g1_i1:82-405(+)